MQRTIYLAKKTETIRLQKKPYQYFFLVQNFDHRKKKLDQTWRFELIYLEHRPDQIIKFLVQIQNSPPVHTNVSTLTNSFKMRIVNDERKLLA